MHARKEAQSTELPLFVKYSSNQVGQNFGERLANSIEEVFNQGFENVITIGNDCPKLDTETIQNAQKRVEAGQIVLGPSNDGGIYLVALHKSQFDKTAFLQLDWETPQLYDSFRRYIEKIAVEQYDLAILQDVDHLSDLKKIATQLSPQHLLQRFLRDLLQINKKTNYIYILHIIFQKSFNSAFERGPPSFALS